MHHCLKFFNLNALSTKRYLEQQLHAKINIIHIQENIVTFSHNNSWKGTEGFSFVCLSKSYINSTLKVTKLSKRLQGKGNKGKKANHLNPR